MEDLKKLNETETRRVYGGKPYCKVCGYSNWSEWKVMGHIAAKHPTRVLRMMWHLGTSQLKAVASLFSR